MLIVIRILALHEGYLYISRKNKTKVSPASAAFNCIKKQVKFVR